MGKEKIEDIMLMGYNSKYCHRASAFEVELAKLITACTIMPTMNVGFDFEKYDDALNIIFYPTGRADHDIEECKIELDKGLMKGYQLCSLANRIRTHMQIESILTEEDCLSKGDDVFWSALDDAAMRAKRIPGERQGLINRVSAMSLKINTLRKILNSKHGQMSEYESVLATILGFIDYYTNSNNPDNELSRLSVNAKSYFRYLDNFECINRAIRDNCFVGHDMQLNDYICARTQQDDRKASYLAGLYQGDYFKNCLYNTRHIIVSNADFLDNAHTNDDTEMED